MVSPTGAEDAIEAKKDALINKREREEMRREQGSRQQDQLEQIRKQAETMGIKMQDAPVSAPGTPGTGGSLKR